MRVVSLLSQVARPAKRQRLAPVSLDRAEPASAEAAPVSKKAKQKAVKTKFTELLGDGVVVSPAQSSQSL